MSERYDIFLRPASPAALDSEQLLAQVASLPQVTVEVPNRWLVRAGGREVLIEQAVVEGWLRGLDLGTRLGDGDPELLCDTAFALCEQAHLLAFDPQLGRNILAADRQAVVASFDRLNIWTVHTVGPPRPLPGDVPFPELPGSRPDRSSRLWLVATLCLLGLLVLLGLCSRLPS